MLLQAAVLQLLPVLAVSATVRKRDGAPIHVSSPKAGDTISLGLEADHTSINISWSTPDAIATRPAFLSLVQGNNISSLSHIATINSSAVNNGTFTWYGDKSPGGCGSPLTYTCYPAPSGCNYSIELKIWDEVAYSGYFTIINPEDEGIASNALCPSAGSDLGPANETFSTSASTISTTTSSATTSSTATSAASGSTSTSTVAASSGGISKTTLGVAIAVPVIVLLALFAFVLWFGRRKGWYVKNSVAAHRSASYPELEGKSAIAVRSDGYKGVADSDYSSGAASELHGQPRAYESAGQEVHYSGGQEVHQLYGDEGNYNGRIRRSAME